MEASDLQATDPNGKSDPFCVVKLGEMQEQSTPVIQATLSPRWNYTVRGRGRGCVRACVRACVCVRFLFAFMRFLHALFFLC